MEPNFLTLSYALDTFYFLMCGALVMWMAAGFSMLEAGLVRGKNTAEILTKNIVLYAIACSMYLLVGYAVMYPGDAAISAYLPGLSFFYGPENTAEAVLSGEDGAPYYSVNSDFFFQVVFVATAMSIVSGAVAERMKLWSFLLFSVVMCGFIYPVQGYWKWGGGFLNEAGFLDFAGSGVVHLCGAGAAFTGALMVGARKGKYRANGSVAPIPGANLPLATLGTFILWLGWFGFNGGSQLKLASIDDANAVAQIFVNTNAGAAGGVIAALMMAMIISRKADLTMVLNGALAGLVSITAEPLTPSPLMATFIGAVGGVLVVLAIVFFDRIRVDDPVGAVAVHGVCGMWGLLAVVLTNADASLSVQLMGLGVILLWSVGASAATWFVIKMLFGLRISEEEEYQGADISECGLEAYPEFGPRPSL